MTNIVLVLNSGSSSIKFQLIDPLTSTALAAGIVEEISTPDSQIILSYNGERSCSKIPIADHTVGLQRVFELFRQHGFTESDLCAVGHRVVHGGPDFRDPMLVNDEIIDQIEQLGTLAPLHNFASVIGIRAARRAFPNIPHVVVFDTAFFHSLPEVAARYAIPRDLADCYKIRRYGFHGTSHQYVANELAHFLQRPLHELNMIVLHLGNGASISAIRAGKAIDTSMGMTPLEGLVMGTRSGDLDPAIPFYLNRVAGLDIPQLDNLLNRQSGLLGLCGSNDFREVMAHREEDSPHGQACQLAYDIYVYRLRKYIGAYLITLGTVDAIAFTAGVGENVAEIREDTLAGLEYLGINIDPQRNREGKGMRLISSGSVSVCVIPTNEELAIARAAWKFV